MSKKVKSADEEDGHPGNSQSVLDGLSAERRRPHCARQCPYPFPGPRLIGEDYTHAQQGAGTGLVIYVQLH